jgi:hypothetical protein
MSETKYLIPEWLGSGKRKSRRKTKHKSNKKLKKTKRKRKTKRVHGYKKRGGSRRSNYCMYSEPTAPGAKQERTRGECINLKECAWGLKFLALSPIRSSRPRCYKKRKQ